MQREAHLPITLKHTLSGWPPRGPNGFEWRGDRLRYMLPDWRMHSSSGEHFAQPTRDDWEVFWAACDRLEIWNLPADFRKPICDGLEINLTMSRDGRSVVSTGQCAEEPLEFVQRILAFHRALQQLVGFDPDAQI